MRLLNGLMLFAAVGAGIFATWNFTDLGKGYLAEVFDSGEFLTLEARYTAEQIMDQQRSKLLPTGQHQFVDPSLQFFPYVLLEVKYSDEGKQTEEGVVLWGLNNGEMVIDTESWETTHGFEDCLNADAGRNDYKIINTLASRNGTMDRESLLKSLRIEPETLDEWIESVRAKQLVVQSGNDYRLHFQNPKLRVKPRTAIRQRLVTKPYKHAVRVSKTYSKSQIEHNARAAFGSDFAIRNYREVFLPVYSIEVQNPDGSVATTYWNSLNGKQVVDVNWK